MSRDHEALPPRILGLDYGDRRVGAAISDPLGYSAQGLETIAVSDQADLVARVAQLVHEYQADRVVVGMPRNMDGSEGPRARMTRAFIERLQGAVEVPVLAWDERWTTLQAERALRETGATRGKRKLLKDRIAAQIMLQSYLDAHRSVD